VRASALAGEFGTPLVVYCRDTVLARARAYARVDPDAVVVYGTKAFPNVALMHLLTGEGLGADVSTLGELEFALRAGVPADRLVFHGNNKADAELRAAAGAGALVVLDALEEVGRAGSAGVTRVLVRLNPGVEADTHHAIRTAHEESKFGLPPDDAVKAVAEARAAGLEVLGLHVHIGSQLVRADESLVAVERLVDVARRCADWSPAVFNVGGGAGVQHNRGDDVPDPAALAAQIVRHVRALWDEPVRLMLEPGRSLVGQAGVTLYTVGAVKGKIAAVDGGMSDNPRPQLYDARYDALLANRADDAPDGTFRIAGKHCESGDVLIEAIELPEPRRGDLLAVPATGAYTLAMASTYNGVPRPAAVLVGDGKAELIRRREEVEELLRFEQ
jgi:diaminopimelate decarboxylase